MRRRPELMQLEIGMSTSRYFPASGTAGFARSFVSGNSREPWPPPMMTQRTLLVLSDWRPVGIKLQVRTQYSVKFFRRKPGSFTICDLRAASEFHAARKSYIVNRKFLNFTYDEIRKLLSMMRRNARFEF